MYRLKYKLTAEDLVDYNMFMALHSKTMQNTMIKLMVVFMLPFILMVLFFKPHQLFLVIMAGALILDVVVVPKLYWKVITKNAEQQVNKQAVAYQELEVTLDDTAIRVLNNQQKLNINYMLIDSISFTKRDCFIVYNRQESLIIPLSAFAEQTEAILAFLQQKLPDKLKG